MMRIRLSGVAKQASKKIATLTAACVMAFSGLALAAPMFFSGSAAAASSPVTISEFMADPSAVTDANGEWVEVQNNSGVAVNLGAGYELDGDAISGSASISNDSYAVICRNTDLATNGGVACDYGDSSMSLVNSGGTITLTDPSNTSLDSVNYSATTPGNSNYLNSAGWSTENSRTFGSGDYGTPGRSNDRTVAVSGADYPSLQSALSAANSGDVITVAADTYYLTSELDITVPVTITGLGNVTIQANNSAWSASARHLIGIYGGTSALPISISNITFDSNSQAYGLDTYYNAHAILNDVTIQNSKGAGLTVNGSTLEATNLATSGNAWGAVNVDPGSGVTTPSVFTLNSGVLAESNQIWSDGSHVAGTATVTVSAPGYDEYKVAGTTAGYFWTNQLSNYATITKNGVTTAYSTIQAAVNDASDGDTINVAAGIYDGFSVADKSNLTLAGDPAGSTIIAPTTLVDSGIQHKYTANMQVSVLVNNSTDITIKDMTIKDNGLAPGLGGPDALVFWNGSTGTLDSDSITGTYAINGIQTGQGIAVDGSSGTVSLTVKDSSISGFQKNGIDVIDGNGATSGATDTTTLNVSDNSSITGAGSTAAIAQNGIVLWDRGGGTVTGTVNGASISGFHYSPLNTADDDYATGILAYGDGSSVTVLNSSLTDSDLAVVNSTNSGTATATDNYWGSATPDFSSLASGDVSYLPYYTDSGLTTLSQSSTSANNIGSLIGSGTNSVLQLSTDQKTITVQQATTIDIPSGTHTSSVVLPVGTEITQTNGNSIDTSRITASTPSTGSFTSLGAAKVVKGALQWGIPGIHLSFSQPITLSIYVGTPLNGQTLSIVHSATGSSDWTSSGIVSPATCVVSAGYCSFQATEASYYAATQTLAPSGNSGGNSASPSSSAPAVVTSSSSEGTSNGSGASSVQGQSTNADSGQTSSTSTKAPATANLTQPKIAAKEAGAIGLRWYWIVLIAIVALALAATVAYRYAEGTDEA